MSKHSIVAVAIIVAAVIAVPLVLKSRTANDGAGETSQAPVESVIDTEPVAAMPRFVDLGTTTCAPCRTMLGVMDELRAQYPGALNVEFVNVNKDRSAIQTYGISAIPTQVFYSPTGEELYRHRGVMRTTAVVAKWTELGYPLTSTVPVEQ